jgi:Flp pilus assembly pilin Flp
VVDARMNNRGQTTIEYILVAVLVILGIIFAFRGAAIDEAISSAAGFVQESLLVEE